MKAARVALTALGLAALAVGVIVVNSASDAASTGPVFGVTHTDDAPPAGVLFRNSAHTVDTDHVTGHGVYARERVELLCYAHGDPVGTYSNTLWYFVDNVTRPTVKGQSNSGFLNSHYINDGRTAAQIDIGVPPCGSATPASSADVAPAGSATTSATPSGASTATSSPPALASSSAASASGSPGAGATVDGIELGAPEGPWQTVGSCKVRQYALGSSTNATTADVVEVGSTLHLVRNGMLAGWTNSGGPAGILGCPLTGEQASVAIQGRGFSVQQFQNGYLYWTTGLPAAVRTSLAAIKAIRWSWNCMALADCAYQGGKVGAVNAYYNYCLAFVYDAYRLGAGQPPLGGPTDENATAAQWWTQNTVGGKVAAVTNAPPGSFVVWSSPAAGGGGHIALSVGSGWAVSTWSGAGATTIHLIKISALAPNSYLGYVISGL